MAKIIENESSPMMVILKKLSGCSILIVNDTIYLRVFKHGGMAVCKCSTLDYLRISRNTNNETQQQNQNCVLIIILNFFSR